MNLAGWPFMRPASTRQAVFFVHFTEDTIESFHVRRSRSRAGTVSDLLQYYQIGQIEVGPCTNLLQIGTNDIEWLTYVVSAVILGGEK